MTSPDTVKPKPERLKPKPATNKRARAAQALRRNLTRRKAAQAKPGA